VISIETLNPKRYELTSYQKENLDRLVSVMQRIESEYGQELLVTSGVRSKLDQERINPGVKSAHMEAAACDISDRDGLFWGWLMDNFPLLEELGVYLEDKSYCVSWVHLQIRVPKSGNRVFIPR
jgi:hypothetical protein